MPVLFQYVVVPLQGAPAVSVLGSLGAGAVPLLCARRSSVPLQCAAGAAAKVFLLFGVSAGVVIFYTLLKSLLPDSGRFRSDRSFPLFFSARWTGRARLGHDPSPQHRGLRDGPFRRPPQRGPASQCFFFLVPPCFTTEGERAI